MIVKRYQRPLLNYVGRMVGNRELALDFTQEIFLKAFAALTSFRPQFAFKTWLFKIASNLVIDHWRKKKIDAFSIDKTRGAEGEGPSFEIPDDEPSVCARHERAELRERIERALQKLPPPLRELFVWRHINELSYAEIAEIKGLPVGTVKNRVFQSKELLRRLLEEDR